jgi:hypothetical protein
VVHVELARPGHDREPGKVEEIWCSDIWYFEPAMVTPVISSPATVI